MKRTLKQLLTGLFTALAIVTAPLAPTTLAAHSLSAEDYAPYPYQIPEVFVSFMKLDPDETLVHHRMDVLPCGLNEPMELKGKDVELLYIQLNDKPLHADVDYTVESETLTILNPPTDAPFQLSVGTRICPRENRSLSGLYMSGENLVTQCESEGFRRITYAPDRPDVMSRYTVFVDCDREQFPVLLSNGNIILNDEEKGWVTFQDPHPKPSYLFALVAGKFDVVEDSFTTMSGKEVDLAVYGGIGEASRLTFAMDALKAAMKWDEEEFGLEYDLGRLNVVGVDDFNAGAMENKGLLIFNSEDLYADIETSEDHVFHRVYAVIGHEYFHNWTGNRITIRDWLQLTLKEGFTTFREQEFSGTLFSPTLQRIWDAETLKQHFFGEQSGPMALPFVPDSVDSPTNLYSTTTYEGGAEIYRMMRWIVGAEEFRKGCDHYFTKYDGTAAVAENFVDAMEEATGRDLSIFRRWYHHVGVPEVTVTFDYDEESGDATLTLTQPEEPLHLPLALSFYSQNGEQLSTTLAKDGGETLVGEEFVLNLTKGEQTYHLSGLEGRPVLSLNHDFSAVAQLNYDRPAGDRMILVQHDQNMFCRCEAADSVVLDQVVALVEDPESEIELDLSEVVLRELADEDSPVDYAIAARMLATPSLEEVMQAIGRYDFDAAIAAVHGYRPKAYRNRDALHALYQQLAAQETNELTAEAAGRRSLKNRLLGIVTLLDDDESLAAEQYANAQNMSDRMTALWILSRKETQAAEDALADFYERFKDKPDCVNRWFRVQAGSDHPNVLDHVKALEEHPAFDITNPNKVRSLIRAFCWNERHFHTEEGYRYLADKILQIDQFNSHIASGLAYQFNLYPHLEEREAEWMKVELERVASAEGLSTETAEIIHATLASRS